jgi:hypothetical protein
MELNKDNYELVMFHLLEGNLNETDELSLMNQIKEDEFLFREWQFFKSTILIADKKVVYHAKSSLLKEEKGVILPMFTKWTAIAASICILAIVVVQWPEVKSTEKTYSTDLLELPTQDNNVLDIQPGVEEVVSAVITREEDLLYSEKLSPRLFITLKASEEEFSIKERKVYSESKGFNTPDEQSIAYEEIHVNLDKPKNGAIHNLQKDSNAQHIVSIPKNKKDELIPEEVISKESVAVTSEDTKVIISKEATKTRRQRIVALVTNNSIERIKEATSVMYAKMRNPQVRITRNSKNKRPSFNIELETDGYQAIASIKPFKNRIK